MSPKILNTVTANSTNPLTRARPLTPEQYATLHHVVRAKASQLLIDLNGKLEAELRAQLDEAMAAQSKLADEVAEADAEVKRLDVKKSTLTRRKATLKAHLVKAAAVNEEMEKSLTEVRNTQAQRDEALEEVAQLNRELHVARREEDRVRKLVSSSKARSANVIRFIEEGDDEGAKRRLAMDNELVERRRTKQAEKLAAAVSDSTPLAG